MKERALSPVGSKNVGSPTLRRQSSTKKTLKRRRVKVAGCDEDINKSVQDFLSAVRDVPVKRETRFKPLPAIGSKIDTDDSDATSNTIQLEKLAFTDSSTSGLAKYAELDEILSSSFGSPTEKNENVLEQPTDVKFCNSPNVNLTKIRMTSRNQVRRSRGKDETELLEEKYVPTFQHLEKQEVINNSPRTSADIMKDLKQCSIAVTAMSPMFTRARVSRNDSRDIFKSRRKHQQSDMFTSSENVHTSLTPETKRLIVKESDANLENTNEEQQSLSPFWKDGCDGILTPPKRMSRRNILRISPKHGDSGLQVTNNLNGRYDPTSLCSPDSKFDLVDIPARKPRLPRRCGYNKYLPPLSKTTFRGDES